MKTPEQRQNDMIEAAKKYAKQYEGLMYTIGSIAGIAGIQKAFERGVQFGLHQALDITVEREKAERDAEQQWISVKERLPEFKENAYTKDVLMAFHDGTMAVLPFQRRDGSIKTGHFDPITTVAGWMPLPDAPKDVKE